MTFHIGEKPEYRLVEQQFKNPIRQALWYKQLLDEGRFDTQAELAQALSASRSRVTSILGLLKLDHEVQEFILGLDDKDRQLSRLTERELRVLLRPKI